MRTIGSKNVGQRGLSRTFPAAVLVLLALLPCGALAQDEGFDGDAFAAEMNEALKQRGLVGVTVSPSVHFDAGSSTDTMGSASAGWGDMSATTATGSDEPSTEPPSEDIGEAVDTVVGASNFIAGRLCPNPYRPTKLILHLTAGFNLVFTGETGSQVEWDLEVICNRG